MSWLLLEGHQQFVSAWDLISGISEISNVDLQKAVGLFVKLNALDLVDGGYPIPFYANNKFDGYFLTSDSETKLCIEALRQAVLFGTVSFFDGSIESKRPLEEGIKDNFGLSFFLRKHDCIKAINDKSMEVGGEIPLPSCLGESKPQIPVNTKPSKKTASAQARFIRSLLICFYGEDVANNPRKHIDGRSGEIAKDFSGKDLNCPSGVTVAGWLRDID